MSTITKDRRRHRRHSIREGSTARLEFERGGQKIECPVLNLSGSGLSFSFDPEEVVTEFEEGASLNGIVLSVGDFTLRGDLLLMHVTSRPGSRYVCGALFYPATDTDLLKFRSVIAGMEIAGTD